MYWNPFIGDNETPASIGFVNIGEPVSQIAAGGDHTCVVTQSNKLKCWGKNDFGQLGYGNTTSPTGFSTSLGYVSVGFDVKAVKTSSNTTCVISTSNTAKCWGKNDVGQLGQGNTNNIGDNELPSTISAIPLTNIAAINAGNEHTCASLNNGDVHCWGSGSGGRLGYGNTSTVGDNESVGSVGSVTGINTGAVSSTPAIAYDDQDRLLNLGPKSFTYNRNGEVTSMTDSSTSQTINYTYDVLGNLKQVVLPSKTINYKVDAHNRRISKINGSSVEKFFIWNKQNQLIGTADASGVISARFVYGSKPHVPDYAVIGSVEYQIVSNHLGSPVAVVNKTTGAVVQEIQYDEFGVIIADSNPGFIPFGFAGCLYEHETKLCRFGVRDYDATIGRWLSKDPILFNGKDTNLYGYVLQDPVNFFDPSGKFFIPGAIIGGIIGGLSGAAGAIIQGGSTSEVLASATLGGAAGLLAGSGLGLLGAGLVNAGANATGQFIGGAASFQDLNAWSIGFSFAAGWTGAGFGALTGTSISGAIGGTLATSSLDLVGSVILVKPNACKLK